MRWKTLVRCSASLGALALSTTSALAQTADGQAPDAQETPAEAADENAIVVTGFREALRSAQNIRRTSDKVVDAIIAEDIGKLPDLAVSDTAARIPGVQVVRTGGEASSVLVRGLPDFATTYNGREIFTAETRVVALQDFPSSNIAALEVFKTTTPGLVEAGLAGLVNVRSRRPFDFSGLEVAGSFWALYTAQAGKVTPNANVLVSNRWDTGAGEIGVLLNASYTRLRFLDSEPSNTDFLQTFRQEGNRLICCGPQPNARFPDIQRLFYRSGDRTRPSFNGVLQWRPNDSLEFYAEALFQGFRNKIDDRLVAVPLYNGGAYSNLVFRGGTNLLDSGTITGLADPIFTFQGGTFNKTDTYQFAVGGQYDAGPLRISVDLARTDSTFKGSTESVDRIFAGQGATTVNFDLTTPQFAISGVDFTNPANFLFDGLYEENQLSEGDDYQARVDMTYELSPDFFIRSIGLGARYSDRDANREFGNRFAGFRGRNIPGTNLPLEFRVNRAGFRNTDVQSGFLSFSTPTYQSIRDNIQGLRQFVINQGAGNYTLADVPRGVQYRVNEKTLAGYGQLNYAIGDTIDGVVGLRVVETETQFENITQSIGGLLGQKYTDYLPTANLRWEIAPQFQARLSYTQTRTRPTFAQLNPAISLGPPDPLQGGRRTGGGGNPFLRPIQSNNYDAALEWFFSRNGFASLTLFRRDLEGFIQDQTQDFSDPVLGPIRVTIPTNTRSGRIDGLELQLSTFFDFGGVPNFLRNFGIQANYTHLDAGIEILNPATGQFVVDRITSPEGPGDYGGVSRHTFNVALMYENGPLSGRLTWNKRSKYLDRRDVRGDEAGGFYREEATAPHRVDLSLNYNFRENFTIFADATNLLGEPLRVDFSSARGGAPRANYVRYLRFDEQTLSLGVRVKL
jgi:iron complex outermembrane recepter protein